VTSKGTQTLRGITIGVDISKDTLDAHRLPDGASRRFANTPAGHKTLIAWAGNEVTRIVFEPTGPYHAAFERALARDGVPRVKVNPRQARRFAEATGTLAKTDRCDAAMLARMGLALDLPAQPAPDANLAELRELQLARAALIKDRTAARNRERCLASPC
jgi:transposase